MTHDRLIQAGTTVFLERGYADATIDEIVSVAAVSRATFYLHFKSKLEVMRAIIRSMEEENGRLIEELRQIGKPSRKSIEAWLRRFIEHWGAQSDRFIIGLQALGSEPELSREIQGGVQLTTDILARMQRDSSGLAPDEAALRAELLVHALQQASRSMISGRYDTELVVRVVTDIWAKSLKLRG